MHKLGGATNAAESIGRICGIEDELLKWRGITLTPKPQTLNPKPYTLNPKP